MPYWEDTGIVISGPVFDAVTIGGAVSHTSYLNLTVFCIGGIAHAGHTVFRAAFITAAGMVFSTSRFRPGSSLG